MKCMSNNYDNFINSLLFQFRNNVRTKVISETIDFEGKVNISISIVKLLEILVGSLEQF